MKLEPILLSLEFCRGSTSSSPCHSIVELVWNILGKSVTPTRDMLTLITKITQGALVLSKLQELKERVRKLEERDVKNQQLRDPAQDATPEATPPSQQRSSVASTELVQ